MLLEMATTSYERRIGSAAHSKGARSPGVKTTEKLPILPCRREGILKKKCTKFRAIHIAYLPRFNVDMYVTSVFYRTIVHSQFLFLISGMSCFSDRVTFRLQKALDIALPEKEEYLILTVWRSICNYKLGFCKRRIDTNVETPVLRWLEIVFEIFFTRKRFTFIYIITAFMVGT